MCYFNLQVLAYIQTIKNKLNQKQNIYANKQNRCQENLSPGNDLKFD